MNYKPIIIVAGEPNSIFLEIFFKAIKKKIKSPLLLIASKKLLKLQMNKLKYKKKIKLIDYKKLNDYKINNKSINLIDVDLNQKRPFEKISKKSNLYIKKSFEIAFKIINNGFSDKLINGPISKKNFLKKKYLGITEYISSHFKIQKNAMLIFNKELSVCPITTHMPLKLVSKNINKILLREKVDLIDKFYEVRFGFKPKIGILGLNPHCESIDKYNEDETIIKPTIKYLKKLRFKVYGPLSADTVFLKNNRRKFNVIVGMYHDQVLTPIKTLFEFNAVNITMGLPFLRVSPDHGPNYKMVGKNISNHNSFLESVKFLDQI